MPVTANVYGQALGMLAGGYAALDAYAVDWLSDDIYVALFTDAVAPDQDMVDPTYAGVAAVMTEVAGALGYTTGGVLLDGKTMTYTDLTNVTKLDANNAVWAAATFTARYAVIWADTDVGDGPALAFVDFDADVVGAGGDYTISWDADGIITLTAS